MDFLKSRVYCIIIGFFQCLLSAEREKSVHIWEHYSISKSVERKILHLGSWSHDEGFQLMDTPKWIRRGNLEVRNFFYKYQKLIILSVFKSEL